MAHQAKLGSLSPEQVKTLLGKIAFLKSIDPNFATQLENKYLNYNEQT